MPKKAVCEKCGGAHMTKNCTAKKK